MSPEQPEPAASGTPDNSFKISDPRAMRALAHPVRIAILEHLMVDGPATATECAEVAGLSPSACSYHLRALASHGFVEEDLASAADGRHRPWRARFIGISVDDEPGRPVAVRTASRLLKESFQAHIEELRDRYWERQDDYPAQWRAAAGTHWDVLHVTADELSALHDELHDLARRYSRLDPAQRPPGARRMLMLQEILPGFDPGEELR
jgi:DNA-binding transcriptional ArsR family regulator